MKKSPPPEAEIAAAAGEFQRDRTASWSDRIGPVLQVMLDLLYSGNEKRAWQFLDEAWREPEEGVDRDQFIAELRARLQQSPYYPAIQKYWADQARETDRRSIEP
jgi:hypothetical protein